MEFNDFPKKDKIGKDSAFDLRKPMDLSFDFIDSEPRKLTPHEEIPPEIIEQARAAGLAGEWKGTISGSVFQIDLPSNLGDIWGSAELTDKSILRINYFHLKENAKHKGLGTLMLRTFAATAKDKLGYKKLKGQLVSVEVIKTFLTVFGEDQLVFTDDEESVISGEQALKIKKELGFRGIRVVASLENFDTTNTPKTKITG